MMVEKIAARRELAVHYAYPSSDLGGIYGVYYVPGLFAAVDEKEIIEAALVYRFPVVLHYGQPDRADPWRARGVRHANDR